MLAAVAVIELCLVAPTNSRVRAGLGIHRALHRAPQGQGIDSVLLLVKITSSARAPASIANLLARRLHNAARRRALAAWAEEGLPPTPSARVIAARLRAAKGDVALVSSNA